MTFLQRDRRPVRDAATRARRASTRGSHASRLARPGRVPVHRRYLTASLVAASLLLAACASGGDGDQGAGGAPATASGPRPSSTAKLDIVSPRNGATVPDGGNVMLKMSLEGARIIQETTTDLAPDTGHVHVTVDGQLISMQYQLEQKLPEMPPGQHVVKVEFVAADHNPFDPRVLVQSAFQVEG